MGEIYFTTYIDGIGQIHVKESGLALIPGLDEFVPVGQEKT